MFEKIKNLKVLFMGDAIIDQYKYVTVVGKANKEPVISTRYVRTEGFEGGTVAAANHLRDICGIVDVWIGPHVTLNKRYVEEVTHRKLFVIHEERTNGASGPYDPADYDLVVVTDFGHGMMTKEMREKAARARFLAVNTQTNSQNYGFNLITKYPRADFVVLDELEARLAAQDQVSPIEDVILKLGYKKIIVTMGSNGAIGFDGAFERQKSVASKVVDTMGAGDAFLAAAAPFAAVGCSMRDVIRVGNAAGAAKLKIVGHQRYIKREDLEAELA